MPSKKKKRDSNNKTSNKEINLNLKMNDKITRNSSHTKEQNEVELKSGKPIYLKDKRLPHGWSYYTNGKNTTFFRDKQGKFLKNRRAALGEMHNRGGFTSQQTKYMRDGLQSVGWSYHTDLPSLWMYKLYKHKIEGVDTEILYMLGPNGAIYRSKIKIKNDANKLQLSNEDLTKLLEFKPLQEEKKLETPDENWVFDPDCMPAGWKMKKYTYNSNVFNRVEEVFHYLTPTNIILRGKKAVYDWMIQSDTFTEENFNRFHFFKKEARRKDSSRRSLLTNWSEWRLAEGLPEDWQVREGKYLYQKKVQYKSPGLELFSSRVSVDRFLSGGGYVKQCWNSKTSKERRTVWADWRDDDIPCLPGWQFSIGHKSGKKVIRYRAVKGDGRVFKSRGPLIRYLHEYEGKSRPQLLALKKLLKSNTVKSFDSLRRNDKFIKNFEPDDNYFRFLKIRYDNHQEVSEIQEPKLPDVWMKKIINGVEYFKDPSGKNVFNSRKLLVNQLRRTSFEVSDEDLLEILQDSDEESDLSESEDDETESEDEVISKPIASNVNTSRPKEQITFVDVNHENVDVENNV